MFRRAAWRNTPLSLAFDAVMLESTLFHAGCGYYECLVYLTSYFPPLYVLRIAPFSEALERATKVRFVGPKKRSQSTEYQRHLQAERTRRHRERQKKKKNNASNTDHQLGSLISAQPPTEDDQADQEHSPTPDFGQLATDISFGDGFISTGQEDGDPEINSIEPEPYYNEETDGLQSSEEQQAQTEFPGRENSHEDLANLPDKNTYTDVQYTTQKFIQQFLVGIYGCSAQSHHKALTTHIKAEGVHNHHRLGQLVPRSIPHTLDKQYILSSKTNDETMYLTSEQ